MLFFVIALGTNAQVNLAWAKSMGGPTEDIATAVTVDALGNVYTVGTFQDSCDFDPASSTYTLVASGPSSSLAGPISIFISKLDPSGNFVWAKMIGDILVYSEIRISSDTIGNIYVVGSFRGTTDFDPGIGVYNLTPIGLTDVFIFKLDSSGNFLWAKQLGGSLEIQSNDIVVDLSGNVFTTGRFQGTIDLDPGVGTFNITSMGSSGYGYDDVFISKLNAGGDFVWAKSLQGTNNDVAYAITSDKRGNVYTTGSFQNNADFDPGSAIFNLSATSSGDIFISKLDSNGIFVWAKQFSGPYSEGHSIAVDELENVYSTGFFGGTVDFDPGTTSIYNLTSVGPFYGDVYISKLNASGDFVWVKQLGGSAWDYVNSIKVDTMGNTYTLGYFYGASDYDPGSSTYTITPAGSCDIFLTKLDNFGNFVWLKQWGGTSPEIAYALDIDIQQNLYLAGWFPNTVDFDPSIFVYNLTPITPSYPEIFVMKLYQDATAPVTTSDNSITTSSTLAVDVATNISQYSSENNILISPNPNSGLFYYSINLKSPELQISIFDITGKLLKTIPTTKLNVGSNFLAIDVSELSSGIYFLKTFNENIQQTAKFVINK